MLHEEANPYLSGLFAPIEHETSSVEARVIAGEVPRDVRGAYVRNGPNPRFEPRGRHHWFDGDGMLHAARLSDGRVFYTSRWIETEPFVRERQSGRVLWSGIMESTRDNPPGTPYKNTANTDVIPFAGGLLATWWLAGVPYLIDPVTLETRGRAPFATRNEQRVASHAKVHPTTGELLFFDYGMRPPFMTYGRLAPGRDSAELTPIDLPGPRLPHDMAITEDHVVLMDLPVLFDMEAMKKGRWASTFQRDQAARFGVLPRTGPGGAIRWFDAKPCYVYHVVNAHEEGRRIVLTGCRVEDPLPAPDPRDGAYARMMANLRVDARLYRWTFDLETGAVTEGPLAEANLEFPAINPAWRGKRSRYGYLSMIAAARSLLFEGVAKYDAETGALETHPYGPGRFGSEPAFAPRLSPRGEDDGYILTFVSDERERRSELLILDAQHISGPPIARVSIPERIPVGFHACFAPDAEART